MDGLAKDACLICREEPKTGVTFCNTTLCSTCERLILQISPGDPGYERIVEQIKEFWVRNPAYISLA